MANGELATIYVFRDYDDEGRPIYYAEAISNDRDDKGEDVVLARAAHKPTADAAVEIVRRVADERGFQIDAVVRRDKGE